MTEANLILGVVAAILLVYAARRGKAGEGVRIGALLLRRTAAVLLVAFAIIGYVNVMETGGLIQRWIGPDSGWSGLLLAALAGMLLPGGPYVVFPLIAALYLGGAGIGPAVVLVTSWAMLALISVAFELPLMGWRFTLIRWGVGLPVPILVGAVAQAVWG
ncbi:MAG: permease [Anaerolineae bacterium]|nr:permease [Anaerolineae bacterium]